MDSSVPHLLTLIPIGAFSVASLNPSSRAIVSGAVLLPSLLGPFSAAAHLDRKLRTVIDYIRADAGQFGAAPIVNAVYTNVTL